MVDNGAGTVKGVSADRSWFRGIPHYWAEAWLPFAYAVACVEVFCESSEKTEVLYNKPAVLKAGLYLLTIGQR